MNLPQFRSSYAIELHTRPPSDPSKTPPTPPSTSLQPDLSISTRLHASISTSGPVTAETLTHLTSNDRDSFTSFFASRVGPHGFVLFHDVDYGGWIK
ncbi:hypothetical protein MMC10_007088 [Thelotrema lepadinum]|nr:hypothetical protein [Thelotrema lepadinum]